MKAAIRLFKALPLDIVKFTKPPVDVIRDVSRKTIRKGFVFDAELFNYYSVDYLLNLSLDMGLTPEQLNSSFHKSWAKVRDAKIEQLVIEQIVHYFTTYGFESLGIKADAWIPAEKLEIPELDPNENFRIVVIRGMSKYEIKARLIIMLESGIALKDQTMDDVMEVALWLDLSEDEIERCKNREVKIQLYNWLGKLPANPVEFLRFAIYQVTDRTLLIKDRETIAAIKGANRVRALNLFRHYIVDHGLAPLSSIFYRFKPLFLAFKKDANMNPIINKIRRLAPKYHRPMGEDFLNTVTGKIKSGGGFSVNELNDALHKVNTFRKVRLLYALNYRIDCPQSILYKIRNGKGYAEELRYYLSPAGQYGINSSIGAVKESIVQDLKPKVEGKTVYIPNNVDYALPATEKQFTGNFPSGTCIRVPSDMIFGIYWENVDGRRIDLDLSMVGQHGKIGWNSMYRSDDRDILFSGDITDAKNGASELFYIRNMKPGVWIMYVNYFNYMRNVPVPFKIVVGKEVHGRLERNYMIDPNNVVAISESVLKHKQMVLGLVVTSEDECQFYFSEVNIGKNITSTNNPYTVHVRQWLIDYYTRAVGLREMLEQAGAVMTDMPADPLGDAVCDINLSPEAVDKSIFIALLSGGQQ